MKICVFGTRGFPGIQGGVERHCEELYHAMPSSCLIIVYRRKPYVTSKQQYVINSNIRFVDIVSTRIKGFETFFHSLLSAFCCIFERPDIVHVHNIGPGLFIPLLKLFRLKVVLTYHSPNYEHDKWGLLTKKILKLGEFLSLKFADRIIFVNQYQLMKFGITIINKSVYLPNGVNLPNKSKRIDYLLSLSLEPNMYILSVGRITQEKGFDYLIDAFRSLNLSDYKLVIAGNMDHQHAYVKKLYEKGAGNDVVFTGFVEGEKLSQLYSCAALFVLPSYNEGFPLVLLEAMSYGLPILLSDIQANQQVKLQNVNYFKVGNVPDLAEHITLFLKEKARTSYDLSMYNWDSIAKQVFVLYQQICAKI